MDFMKKMGYVTSKSTRETLRKIENFNRFTMHLIDVIIMKEPSDFKRPEPKMPSRLFREVTR